MESPHTFGAHNPHGNNPPAWALTDFRDDGHNPQAFPVTSSTVANGSTTSTPPSKPSSMSSPQDFEFVKELGTGSWSTVMEAIQAGSENHYAVKILSKSQLIKQKKVKYASIEKDSLIKLSGTHPGIVKMYAAFQDDTSLYFVLELAPHGDLADLVKKFGSLSLRCMRWYTAQIVDAVLWMHSKGILHRDLKPENVLLDNDLRVKLADFGSAYISPTSDLSPRSSSFVGSAAYVSPELLNRASKTTSNSSDLWAIGCTVCLMVSGTPLFAAINDYQSFRRIEALDYTFIEGFYDVAKDFVQKLLVLDPSDRLGVEPKSSPLELREHPLFSDIYEPSSQQNLDRTPIRWDTLWTDPPVAPETGLVQPALRTVHDDSDTEGNVWDDVVHEFSLVNVRSPNGGPIAADSLLLPTGPPIDVPPDELSNQAIESVSNGQSSAGQVYAHGTYEDIEDPLMKAKDWSGIISSEETIHHACSVRTVLRRGLLKHPRTCALILTSHPRVLCVAIDHKDKAPKPSDIKYSFTFLSRREGDKTTRKGDVIVEARADLQLKKLFVRTTEKEYAYDFSDERVLKMWVQEMTSLIQAS